MSFQTHPKCTCCAWGHTSPWARVPAIADKGCEQILRVQLRASEAIDPSRLCPHWSPSVSSSHVPSKLLRSV